LGKLEDAEASYRKVINIKPNDAVAHYNLGVISDRLGRHEAAEEYFRETIKINPNHAGAHANLSSTLLKSFMRLRLQYP